MKILITFFYFLISLNIYAANKQVEYGPTAVELIGKLKRETFPGRPNYESIKGGDEIETHYYLSLDQKIDVIKNKNDKLMSTNDESVKNVDVLQLVISNDSDWAKLKKAGVGTSVKIKGTLFKRHTGHHHSRILLEVQNIRIQ
ncbi:MAG: DUF4431 domain-containing protein [Bacteriovorax sp.]|nr:DUF4431 domain-containing protein [Bacteriovorax sp.]